MNRARAVMAAVAAAIGTTVAAGVLVVGGGGSAAGSTIPTTRLPVPVVYQTPTPVVMIPLPTAVLDHWQCDEISCRPVHVYFGQ